MSDSVRMTVLSL